MPTHGSLSKAGKARKLNPVRNWREGKQSRKQLWFRGKKKKVPRVRNRRRYEIATMCPACGGPIGIGAFKCWRCNTRLTHKGLRPVIKDRRRR